MTARPSTPATATGGTSTPRPTPTLAASSLPWPAEWQTGLCAAFADLIVAQQVARDIGRSLDAKDKDNATGLAHELQGRVTELGTALAGLPTWSGSTNVVTAVTSLLEQDGNLAAQYLRYLEDNRNAALGRAHDIEATLRKDVIPAVMTAVMALETQGLACPGVELELETP